MCCHKLSETRVVTVFTPRWGQTQETWSRGKIIKLRCLQKLAKLLCLKLNLKMEIMLKLFDRWQPPQCQIGVLWKALKRVMLQACLGVTWIKSGNYHQQNKRSFLNKWTPLILTAPPWTWEDQAPSLQKQLCWRCERSTNLVLGNPCTSDRQRT